MKPLFHLAEGVRLLLIEGDFTSHLPKTMLTCLGILLVPVPIVRRKLRGRMFGED